MDENQRLFEAGERAADDTRCLFTPFTRIRPETFDLVDDWLESYPASPYAHAAKAWGDRAMSWQIRGDGVAREIYPEALARFGALQDAAWEHAGIAYRARPRLIAASDALIMMANPQRASGRRDEVLAEVMATDPNQGTLKRATAQILRGWGGSFAEGAALCDRYASRVPGAATDAVTRCKLPVARNFKEEWPWMLATLQTGAFPDLDYLRMDFIIGAEMTREEAEIAHRVMSNPGYELLDHLST